LIHWELLFNIKMDYKIRVLDIGARYGLHPSWKNLKTDAEFILVDADPKEIERLKERYKNKKNFFILHTAISNKEGMMNLNILANPAMNSSQKRIESSPLFKDENRSKQTKISEVIQVEMSSISKICKKFGDVDFIKIDIEGCEMEALESIEDFSSILGIRSEVNFAKLYPNDVNSSFSEIHNYLLNKGYMLVNLDYLGKGDAWSSYVSENTRYGSLVSTDGLWIKDPKKFVKKASTIEILKMSIFMFLNNGPDLAIWLLLHKKKDIYNSKLNKLKKYSSELLVKHFYSIKWSPSQSIKEHEKIFNQIFDFPYPSMNKYNESEVYNPVENL